MHPNINLDDPEDEVQTWSAPKLWTLTANKWHSSTHHGSIAGTVHPYINLDDTEDEVDTSVLVGPQAQDVHY